MSWITLGAGVAAFLLLIGSFTLLHRVTNLRRWKLVVQFAATALRLEFDPGGWLRPAGARGQKGPFQLELSSQPARLAGASRLLPQLALQTNLGAEVQIGKETLLSETAKRLGTSDLAVGIPAFDAAFFLKGSTDIALLSRLHYRSRAAMWSLVTVGGAEVRDGRILWAADRPVSHGAILVATARKMLELASSLTDDTHGTHARAVLAHASNDADVGFRRTCLSALVTALPGSTETQQAIQRAASDPDPGMRYLSARSLGLAGRNVIQELVRNGNLPDEFRAEAIALLGPKLAGGLALASEQREWGGLSLEAGGGAGNLSEVLEIEVGMSDRETET